MFSFVKFKNLALSAAGLVLALGASAQATELNTPFMATGGLTSQPIGHYEFCKRLPNECNLTSAQTAPIKLDQATWAKIVQVNLDVNANIKPVTDMELYGQEEYWAYPVDAGDCEDYVLLKRRELAEAGLPLGSLLITVLRKPDGEGHAVLTVRTDRGDFILDNLTDAVKNWQETDYTYLKRQAANHTGRWVSIETPSNLVVGAVK
ncbi:transglutaminase-like cysteine peptidase [Pseudochrobactrum kiredjianiae]|uniref:Transglutaminase-like cysteine peptidase n=1 Tax=Pseudochrobactrum kiredjianiae TaxID=386305 RepID=A0ABW3V646_9HYPH|nr:transglutaminase-like cysteine peptidase [Pseudochrobactrum kiredjianiae]MDM7849625.1 transglutaminase-like cysteine peptidase [Pseudochrobactrum kiredjianiae]